MYEKDLALNDLHWLMCHKTKPYFYTRNQTKFKGLSLTYYLPLAGGRFDVYLSQGY